MLELRFQFAVCLLLIFDYKPGTVSPMLDSFLIISIIVSTLQSVIWLSYKPTLIEKSVVWSTSVFSKPFQKSLEGWFHRHKRKKRFWFKRYMISWVLDAGKGISSCFKRFLLRYCTWRVYSHTIDFSGRTLHNRTIDYRTLHDRFIYARLIRVHRVKEKG